MTTIIADKRTMKVYSDSGITMSNGAMFKSRKVFTHDGSIFGLAGDIPDMPVFMRWIEDGKDHDSKPDLGDVDILELDSDGNIWIWDSTCERLIVDDEYFAVGSGADRALVLLDYGVDAMTALHYVEVRDTFTKAPFIEFTLER